MDACLPPRSGVRQMVGREQQRQRSGGRHDRSGSPVCVAACPPTRSDVRMPDGGQRGKSREGGHRSKSAHKQENQPSNYEQAKRHVSKLRVKLDKVNTINTIVKRSFEKDRTSPRESHRATTHVDLRNLDPTTLAFRASVQVVVRRVRSAIEARDSTNIARWLENLCLLAAEEDLRVILCRKDVHALLAKVIVWASSACINDLVRSGLCCLWNLSRPEELRPQIAERVAHALYVAACGSEKLTICHGLEGCEERVEWSARVTWLLAEEPEARAHLSKGGLRQVLLQCKNELDRVRRSSKSGGCASTTTESVRHWVQRALCRWAPDDVSDGEGHL